MLQLSTLPVDQAIICTTVQEWQVGKGMALLQILVQADRKIRATLRMQKLSFPVINLIIFLRGLYYLLIIMVHDAPT